MLVSRTPRLTSHRCVGRVVESGVYNGVEVVPQGAWVDGGKPGPTAPKFGERGGWAWQGDELGYRFAIAGDRQTLAPLDAINYFAAVITKVADGHVCHDTKVSRVRLGGLEPADLGPQLVETDGAL